MPNPEIALELIGLQKEWMAAWGRRDRAALDAILAPEFILTSSTSVEPVSRERWLERATAEGGSDPFHYEDFHITVIGDKAIVRSLAIQTVTVHEVDAAEAMLVTDVWVRRGDRWRIASRHSQVPPAPAEA
jgi:ketosteroid isomerase-like protein